MADNYEKYRHYNNKKIYRLLCMAVNHETEEPMVIYCSDENPDGLKWARTAREFHAKFKKV